MCPPLHTEEITHDHVAQAARRRTRRPPRKWFVLLAWLILAVALGPLAGKLGEVEETGPNAFLPRGAESAKVNTELEKFRTDTLMPAVVVYTG